MSDKICSVDGCGRIILCKGFCSKHYYRYKTHGDPLKVKKVHSDSGICKVEGCNKKHDSKGYCSVHYQRWKKYGDPLCLENEVHGMSHSREYIVWSAMKKRCYCKNNINYNIYGGRGITVCDRWRNSFTALYEDMGPRPTSKHQLDRIDNDGNYEPGNCRWVTRLENMHNRGNSLSLKDAKKIIQMYSTGKYKQVELCNIFKISTTYMHNIVTGKTKINIS